MLDRLNIPVIKFPKGNPQDEKSWLELSWRNLLRHIYRQERLWQDIADKQHDSDEGGLEVWFHGKSVYGQWYLRKAGMVVANKMKRILYFVAGDCRRAWRNWA